MHDMKLRLLLSKFPNLLFCLQLHLLRLYNAD